MNGNSLDHYEELAGTKLRQYDAAAAQVYATLAIAAAIQNASFDADQRAERYQA